MGAAVPVGCCDRHFGIVAPTEACYHNIGLLKWFVVGWVEGVNSH